MPVTRNFGPEYGTHLGKVRSEVDGDSIVTQTSLGRVMVMVVAETGVVEADIEGEDAANASVKVDC